MAEERYSLSAGKVAALGAAAVMLTPASAAAANASAGSIFLPLVALLLAVIVGLGALVVWYRCSLAQVRGHLAGLAEDAADGREPARNDPEKARLRGMLDALPIPVWYRDRGASIAGGNPAFVTAVDGRSLEHAIAEAREVLGGESGGRALAARAHETGAPERERHHVVIEGARRLLEITEAPTDSAGESVGYALDFTAAEEAEADRARHIAAHREVLEHLATAIVIYGPDTRVKFFNQAFVRLWQLDGAWLATEPSRSEVLEAKRERRLLPESADFPAFKRDQLKLFTSLLEPLEELMHLPDGRTLRAVITPHPFGGLLYIYEDVSDSIALERSHNTLIAVQRETLDNLYEGVAVFGGDGRLQLWNPAYARIWDLDEALLASSPHVSELLDHIRRFFEDRGDWDALRERIMTETLDRMPLGGRLERSDATMLDYNKIPLPDGAVLWSYMDVTDSTRVERALRERNVALEAADRLKSEFVANVSYELRTPLNAIIGFAEILQGQYFGALNLRQQEYSDGIVEASNRLISLIDDILDLAVIEAGQMTLEQELLDIHALLVSVFNLVRDWARKKKIVIDFDCSPDTGTLYGDERRLKQALFNLMSNAIKFTRAGGRIRLAAEHRGDEIVMSVSDSGIGVPPDQHERVWERFEQVHGSDVRPPGVGIGLALVKSFIELHGGRVGFESVVDEGTSVMCYLPAPISAKAGDKVMPIRPSS